MNSYLAFQRRVSRIPFHGMGLSVDVYSPDLCELMGTLARHGLSCGYLEIFKASHGALKKVRSRLSSLIMNYHAEGLWVSQPDWKTAYPVQEELETAATHLFELGSYWVNQECASKQMVGYSFGTYLPPLFTSTSATVTAHNTLSTQEKLDVGLRKVMDRPPLLLLETPPLTYFGFGDLSYSEFFRCLTESCSCGLVLDIGHLWTVFRYAGEWRHHSLDEFLDRFLQTFPLERVVQIHLAGLDRHPILGPDNAQSPSDQPHPIHPPDWIDSHGAPIPKVLWEMLERVLQSPDLVNLKGIALEVDTKPIDLIVEEFACFRSRFDWWEHGRSSREIIQLQAHPEKCNSAQIAVGVEAHVVQELKNEYRQYAGAVTGREDPSHPSLEDRGEESKRQLETYVHGYLPYEVLVWGGDLKEMFPQTIQRLEEQGIDFSTFASSWYDYPRPIQEPYDFFLLKIEYFVEFVDKYGFNLRDLVFQEAKALREGYALANEL